MNRHSLLAVSLGIVCLGGADLAGAQPAPDCKVQPAVKPKAEALLTQVVSFDKAGKGELGLFEAVQSLGYDAPQDVADLLKKRGKVMFTRTGPGAGDFANNSVESTYDWLFDIHIPATIGGKYTVTDKALSLKFSDGTTPYVKNLVTRKPGLHLVEIKVTPDRIDVNTSSDTLSRCVIFK